LSTQVSIDGEIRSEQQACVPVTDRGFLYGDSIYEVIRTYGGRPYLLEEHLVRLARSAERLAMSLPGGLEPIRADVAATLAVADNPESTIRVIVTRGSGPIQLDPRTAGTPRRVVIVFPFQGHPAALYSEGALIHLVPSGRSDQGIAAGAKSGNYLVNLLALGVAKRHGAHEAILLDHRGRVTEGASSNLFVLRDGGLQTPPLDAGILEGITRRQVFSIARSAGLRVTERPLSPADLRAADEIFLTSTLREIMPVTRVLDERGESFQVGEGVPGSTTRRLHQLYRQAAGVGGDEGE
jgi:branched-chain amino acid aminotransferase